MCADDAAVTRGDGKARDSYDDDDGDGDADDDDDDDDDDGAVSFCCEYSCRFSYSHSFR